MPSHDYSNWFTKQRAAEIIGCSTKTIEQLAKDRQLQAVKWKRPETGAHIAVYHPDDVERVRRERNPDAPAFVLPPEDSQNSQTAALTVPGTPNAMVLLAQMLERISSQNSERAWPPPLWLSESAAVAYSGLGIGYLRKTVPWEKHGPHGVKVCRRTDLDRL